MDRREFIKGTIIVAAGGAAVTAGVAVADTLIGTDSGSATGLVVDFYGISSHTGYRNSPQYGNDDNTLDVTMRSKASWVRDLLSIAGGFDQDALWRRYTAAGLRGFHATVGIYGTSILADQPTYLNRMNKSADLLTEVTGWNEPDGKAPIGTWLAPTAAWQKWLYTVVKGNILTSHIKVGLGALRGANPHLAVEQAKLMAACDGYYDFVNLHIYPGPKPDSAIRSTIDSRISLAKGHTVIVSEYGGSTANMSLLDQARVCTTGMKHFADIGTRCFVYEVWDDPDPTGKDLQSNFGVYESTGADKPAVVALRALV